jgi:alkylhydroperoxidase family enzyme
MIPMFLPDVEHQARPGPYAAAIEAARRAGGDYPQIWHLFAYRQEMTEHLALFTQAALRGPSPLGPGLRELIAAYTSARNHCPF